MIVTAPSATPVTTPLSSTVAFVLSLELQVTVLSVASSGLTFAVRVIVLSAGVPFRQEDFFSVSIDRNGVVMYCFCK